MKPYKRMRLKPTIKFFSKTITFFSYLITFFLLLNKSYVNADTHLYAEGKNCKNHPTTKYKKLNLARAMSWLPVLLE
jgi:hypothetical protein